MFSTRVELYQANQLDIDLLGAVMDGLEGTTYATDSDGRILAVGKERWLEFAEGNGAQRLGEMPPIGSSLFDLIVGDETKALYRRIHKVALGGKRRISFAFRCDAPDVERRMRMAVGPLRLEGDIVGVLYQATVLAERTRPPMHYLDPVEAWSQYKADAAPIITACSICAKIQVPADEEWVEPEIYYQRGGTSKVRLSHGVCPPCADTLGDLCEAD